MVLISEVVHLLLTDIFRTDDAIVLILNTGDDHPALKIHGTMIVEDRLNFYIVVDELHLDLVIIMVQGIILIGVLLAENFAEVSVQIITGKVRVDLIADPLNVSPLVTTRTNIIDLEVLITLITEEEEVQNFRIEGKEVAIPQEDVIESLFISDLSVQVMIEGQGIENCQQNFANGGLSMKIEEVRVSQGMSNNILTF